MLGGVDEGQADDYQEGENCKPASAGSRINGRRIYLMRSSVALTVAVYEFVEKDDDDSDDDDMHPIPYPKH